MGCYGGNSVKALKLYSNKNWVHGFHEKKPEAAAFDNSAIYTRTEKANGSGIAVTGGGALKGTQHYPDDFGHRLLDLYVFHENGDADQNTVGELDVDCWGIQWPFLRLGHG